MVRSKNLFYATVIVFLALDGRVGFSARCGGYGQMACEEGDPCVGFPIIKVELGKKNMCLKFAEGLCLSYNCGDNYELTSKILSPCGDENQPMCKFDSILYNKIKKSCREGLHEKDGYCISASDPLSCGQHGQLACPVGSSDYQKIGNARCLSNYRVNKYSGLCVNKHLMFTCGQIFQGACDHNSSEPFMKEGFKANGNGPCDMGLKVENGICVNNTRINFNCDHPNHKDRDYCWLSRVYKKTNVRRNMFKYPFNRVTFIGTHNSFNTVVDLEKFPNKSYKNILAMPQHAYSTTDQLNLGARSLEMDFYKLQPPYDTFLYNCHAQQMEFKLGLPQDIAFTNFTLSNTMNLGCNEKIRSFPRYFEEMRIWLDANPNEFLPIVFETRKMFSTKISTDELISGEQVTTPLESEARNLDIITKTQFIEPLLYVFGDMLLKKSDILSVQDTSGLEIEETDRGYSDYKRLLDNGISEIRGTDTPGYINQRIKYWGNRFHRHKNWPMLKKLVYLNKRIMFLNSQNPEAFDYDEIFPFHIKHELDDGSSVKFFYKAHENLLTFSTSSPSDSNIELKRKKVCREITVPRETTEKVCVGEVCTNVTSVKNKKEKICINNVPYDIAKINSEIEFMPGLENREYHNDSEITNEFYREQLAELPFIFGLDDFGPDSSLRDASYFENIVENQFGKLYQFSLESLNELSGNHKGLSTFVKVTKKMKKLNKLVKGVNKKVDFKLENHSRMKPDPEYNLKVLGDYFNCLFRKRSPHLQYQEYFRRPDNFLSCSSD